MIAGDPLAARGRYRALFMGASGILNRKPEHQDDPIFTVSRSQNRNRFLKNIKSTPTMTITIAAGKAR